MASEVAGWRQCRQHPRWLVVVTLTWAVAASVAAGTGAGAAESATATAAAAAGEANGFAIQVSHRVNYRSFWTGLLEILHHCSSLAFFAGKSGVSTRDGMFPDDCIRSSSFWYVAGEHNMAAY